MIPCNYIIDNATFENDVPSNDKQKNNFAESEKCQIDLKDISRLLNPNMHLRFLNWL